MRVTQNPVSSPVVARRPAFGRTVVDFTGAAPAVLPAIAPLRKQQEAAAKAEAVAKAEAEAKLAAEAEAARLVELARLKAEAKAADDAAIAKAQVAQNAANARAAVNERAANVPARCSHASGCGVSAISRMLMWDRNGKPLCGRHAGHGAVTWKAMLQRSEAEAERACAEMLRRIR